MMAQESVGPLLREGPSQAQTGPASPAQALETGPRRTKAARRLAAYACLAVGVAGLALPILPGIPFLILGLSMLGRDHPIARPVFRLIEWARRKGR